MAGLTIKGYASLLFFTLFTGCSLSSITAQAELEAQTPPVSSSGLDSNSGSEGVPASYFVEIRMKGESVSGTFRQASVDIYANGVEFQNLDLNVAQAFVNFEGTYGNEGFHWLYGFTDVKGNTFNTRRYIGGKALQTSKGPHTLRLYYWIKRKSYLFGRNHLNITVPVDKFDPDIHTNIALFTVTAYPDFNDTREDLIIFDGFKPK